MRVLAGDIGGTHARLLLSEFNKNSRQDIAEVLLQVAVYAGVPTANSAFAIAKRTFAEMDDLNGGEN